MALRVWIDQDLCTGDGLCTDHCPEIFRLLDDGISYVVGPDGVAYNFPGGAAQPAPVAERLRDAVIAAAEDCPGECIFLEERVTPGATFTFVGVDDSPGPDWDEDVAPADAHDVRAVSRWPRSVHVEWRRSD